MSQVPAARTRGYLNLVKGPRWRGQDERPGGESIGAIDSAQPISATMVGGG